MPRLTGTVVIAQEGRLHVIDDQGAGHLMVLSAKAAAETAQLHALQARQSRVRINYSTAKDILGLVAERIELVEPEGRA